MANFQDHANKPLHQIGEASALKYFNCKQKLLAILLYKIGNTTIWKLAGRSRSGFKRGTKRRSIKAGFIPQKNTEDQKGKHKNRAHDHYRLPRQKTQKASVS